MREVVPRRAAPDAVSRDRPVRAKHLQLHPVDDVVIVGIHQGRLRVSDRAVPARVELVATIEGALGVVFVTKTLLAFGVDLSQQWRLESYGLLFELTESKAMFASF